MAGRTVVWEIYYSMDSTYSSLSFLFGLAIGRMLVAGETKPAIKNTSIGNVSLGTKDIEIKP